MEHHFAAAEEDKPDIVAGPRIEKVISARAETLGISYKEMEKQYLDKGSLRRMVTAQDVAVTLRRAR